jgi:hypothetical protein
MLFQLPVVLAYSPVAPLARTAGIFLLAVAVVALAALEASLEQPIENALTEPGAIESIGLPTDQGFRARDCTEAWLVARSLQRKPQSHQSIHATVRDPLLTLNAAPHLRLLSGFNGRSHHAALRTP